MTSANDRIEKTLALRAPRSRVWRALTNADEIGTWLRVTIASNFAVVRPVTERVTYPGYEHVIFSVIVERMDAERLFALRWHPAAVDPKVDYSSEPTTLVEFRLDETAQGTLLTVIESGFDRLPAG